MSMLFCFCDHMQNCRGEKGLCPGVLRGPELGPSPGAGRRERKATAWQCGEHPGLGGVSEKRTAALRRH